MKLLIIIAFLFIWGTTCSQDIIVLNTDSSRIETDTTLRYLTIVKEYMKNKNLVTMACYTGENIIQTKGQYDTLDNIIGIWYKYDENGILSYQIDYDNRTWKVYQKKQFPLKSYMDQMKAKADKMVINAYGLDFFNKHVKWNIEQSILYYKEGGSSNWTDPINEKPSSLLIEYDLVTTNGNEYDNMILFQLNRKGELSFPFHSPDDVKGFEKIAPNSTFKLTEVEAIKKAKSLGLVETDSTKAKAFLFWEYLKDKKLTQFNGQFKFYVTIKTNSKIDIKTKEKPTIIDQYDVYIFNPWTGNFIEKKKMKTTRELGRSSDNCSDLLPDE